MTKDGQKGGMGPTFKARGGKGGKGERELAPKPKNQTSPMDHTQSQHRDNNCPQ